MTAPTPPPRPAQPTSTPPPRRANPERQGTDLALVTAVAAALASGASASAVASRLGALLAKAGFASEAVRWAVRLAQTRPLARPQMVTDTASAITRQAETYYRGAWVVNSARRLTRDSREGGGFNLDRERKLFDTHVEAARKRTTAAQAVDKAVDKHGRTLGWYAKMDARTTAECKFANGRNFVVDKRPPMGYPGSVHVHCRCVAGPPHPTAKTVYERRSAA